MNPKLQFLAEELRRAVTDRNRLTTLWCAYQMFLRKEITHHEYLELTRAGNE